MPQVNPRRSTKSMSSRTMSPPTAPSSINTVMQVRKGATFHSPSNKPADNQLQLPFLPRRSQTSLEDVVEAHKRRVALTLGDIDRGLSSVDLDSDSQEKKSFRDDASPVPRGFLNPSVAPHCPEAHKGIMSDILMAEPADYTVGGRSLRPRRSIRRPQNYEPSDSGIGSSIHSSGSGKRSISTALTSFVDSKCAKSAVGASAITRSAAADPSTLEALPHMTPRARNRIEEHIFKPLLAKPAFKDFHPIIRDCPRRINAKEIVCLRDLEKTLVFLAPERSRSAKLYLDFCVTSIQCIQATVEFLNEREQIRPADRPYTAGYFVDLVAQIRSYAQQVQATREKEEKGEVLDEMDAKSTDVVKLYGGVVRNGRPAELVHIKNGKAISIATGEPIKMETIEEDEKTGFQTMKRSQSEDGQDSESVLRSMARRKRSASAAELAPKRCREPGCSKEFKRSCDLTKHEKTHSRPWKCREKSCKYHEYGWPTEKELERHINDKHSIAPVLYKCQFPPCPYKSKRESNCKQHMEKSHGWTYVRSKNNGKKNKTSDSTLPTPQTLTHQTPESEVVYTPEEDCDMRPDSFTLGNYFDPTAFPDQGPGYPYPQELMPDLSMDGLPFVSPVDSRQQHTPEQTSPYMENTGFPATNISINFGQGFGSAPDWTLFGEDIYNAAAHVQIPTPPNAVYEQKLNLESFTSCEQVKAESAPHISPIGHGNAMLYTPTSLRAVDESFEYDASEQHQSGDFPLYPTGTNMLDGHNLRSNGLFTDAPSMAIGTLSQSHAQEWFQPFYNSNGVDWVSQDEGFVTNF